MFGYGIVEKMLSSMKTITIKIIKKSVMGVVEGLTATIAQHNPDVDFQSVWASDAEEAKLDIYYRRR